MNWKQVDRLARNLAGELIDETPACNILMVLMQELTDNPRDRAYVEMIANLINSHLFSVSREADTAFREHVAGQRNLLTKGGAA
jgi:hypothetical protein